MYAFHQSWWFSEINEKTLSLKFKNDMSTK